ncbi:hypothetical protein GcC1_094007 [Golovinomyces cichoracearum]|uniref:Uncharacterized protein n=1 Tax=Golovinomyces cichoracearum TaxID=62708 RepID=A0A420ID11_9PEZI|nr:hypothetical protein GcC1_094007 [Golovinomyces cichoracearum]
MYNDPINAAALPSKNPAGDRSIEAREDAPTTAFAIAHNIAHVVKMLDERPRQVAIVKGLNKNLLLQSAFSTRAANAAAITRLLHAFAFLGEV